MTRKAVNGVIAGHRGSISSGTQVSDERMGCGEHVRYGAGRNASIDILRLVFALIIVLHHSRYVLGYEHSIFIGGSLAVEFFFMVSGYLMLSHIDRQTGTDIHGKTGTETWYYLKGKIKGFFPELFFSLIIGFVFVCAAEHWGVRTMAHRLVKNFGEYTLFKMSGLFQSGIDGVIWYLSAMLLAMAILYPLIRRFPDMMKHVGLPLITLFLFGYLCQSQGSPRDPAKWLGFAYKGLLRAIAEISLGGICYVLADAIDQRMHDRLHSRLSAAGVVISGAAELFCYCIPILYMYREKPSADDYFYIFLLFLGIMLTFLRGRRSQKHHQALTCAGRWCARYSSALFLSHLYFAQHINSILPEESFSASIRLAVYLVLSLANGLLVMTLSMLWRRHKEVRHQLCRKIFLRN